MKSSLTQKEIKVKVSPFQFFKTMLGVTFRIALLVGAYFLLKMLLQNDTFITEIRAIIYYFWPL